MPHTTARDGTRLYYEEAGSGTPVIFVHEYAGDFRSWEMQMRFFSRAYRCITYSQRGYPPSDVPADAARYSQDIARDDVLTLMDALNVNKAHVVGHSMGAYTALHVGIHSPARCISVVAAGCGWGSSPDAKKREDMKAFAAEIGKMFAEEGIVSAAAKYADAPMLVLRRRGTPARFQQRRRDDGLQPDVDEVEHHQVDGEQEPQSGVTSANLPAKRSAKRGFDAVHSTTRNDRPDLLRARA